MQKSKLRIIAGQLRGRKILFNSSNNELRPTLNMVRETLFNWLARDLAGANCLDLFAGSGIFSFEALSRGAHYALAIEKNYFTYMDIIENKTNLNISEKKLNVINQDVLLYLQNRNLFADLQIERLPKMESSLKSLNNKKDAPHKKFNLIFLDPPYHNSKSLLLNSISLLNNNNLIDCNNKIYFECQENSIILNDKTLPTNLQLLKSGKAGKVHFYLVTIKF